MNKTYCKPLKRGDSWRSQNFGDNTTIYGPHSGNDEACNVGTRVHAAGDGVIEWAGEFDNSYADNMFWLLDMGGNVAVLNCGDDEPTFIYAHLSTFYVRPGERVKKGQVIALTGNSGYATTGPHLHVEAMPPGYVLNSYLLGRVNPDKYLTEWPENIIRPMATTIKKENRIMPYSDEEKLEIHKIVVAAIDDWSMSIRRLPEDRNQLDALTQLVADVQAIRKDLKK